jgi:isocitrate dehydrogenase kinase/phosphatase
VSPGTLQNLRVNGTLPFTKIGGVIFYDYDDIQRMLEENKRSPHPFGNKNNL